MRISDWSSDVCSSDLRHTGDQPLDRNRSFATLALAGPGTGDRHDFLHLGVRLGAGEHGGDDFPSGEMPLADRRAEIGDAVALEALDDRLQRLFRHVVAFLAERLLQDLAAEFHVLLALLQAHEAADRKSTRLNSSP